MKHFHRTSVLPGDVLSAAEAFFPTIGMTQTAATPRSRRFEGTVGEPGERVSLDLTVKMEGGHYTLVEAQTSAMGESRLDRGVKNYFTRLHKLADSRHALSASY
ncbi:MAG TPA: hypothetical protein VGI97_06645 [Gemmatimonadaceae bacterium]|jgi:hypothetical protein